MKIIFRDSKYCLDVPKCDEKYLIEDGYLAKYLPVLCEVEDIKKGVKWISGRWYSDTGNIIPDNHILLRGWKLKRWVYVKDLLDSYFDYVALTGKE